MRLPNLTIPNGQQFSNEVDVLHITEMSLFGPSALTGTVSIEWSPDGTNWFDTGDVVTANGITTQVQVHAALVRLSSDMVEAAERVTRVHGFGV